MTYKGCVSYIVNGNKWTCEQGGFSTVSAATNWLSSVFAQLMLGWAKLDENGVDVHGEVFDEGEENSIGFTDVYELRCGC